MTQTVQHTAIPWKVSAHNPLVVVDEKCGIAKVYVRDGLAEANAAHIVRCVNSHDALEAKCALLAASLIKADSVNDALVAELKAANSMLKLAGAA